jgi:glucoamylase
MPLMWAHAEYVKLLRSTADGVVFDHIPEVAKRYLGKRRGLKKLEVWKPIRRVRYMRAGETLRIHGDAPFVLHWSADHGATPRTAESCRNILQIDYVDLDEIATQTGMLIEFTFYWIEKRQWEGQNYAVAVLDGDPP